MAIKLSPEIASEPLVQLLAVAGNAVFWGMNLFVGYSAAKVFGGSPILGGVLAALISRGIRPIRSLSMVNLTCCVLTEA